MSVSGCFVVCVCVRDVSLRGFCTCLCVTVGGLGVCDVMSVCVCVFESVFKA